MKHAFSLSLTFLTLMAAAPSPSAADYKPLLGSEWAKAHPGLLPYSKCALTGDVSLFRPELKSTGTWKSPGLSAFIQGALLIGGDQVEGDVFVSCISEKTHLAYKIPVHLTDITNMIEVSVRNHDVRIVFGKDSLDGHTVGDLMGRYHGGVSGFSLLGGGVHEAGYVHTVPNKNSVKAHYHFQGETNSPVGVALGYSTFSLQNVKTLQIQQKGDPFLISSSTQAIDVSPHTNLVRTKSNRILVRLRDGNFAMESPDRVLILSDNRYAPFRILSAEVPKKDTDNAIIEIVDQNVTTVMALDGTLFYSLLGDIAVGKTDSAYVYQTPEKSVIFRNYTERNFDTFSLRNLTFVRDSKW